MVPPTLAHVCINDMLKVIGAVGKGVEVEETPISRMLFAGDFFGMSDTSEGSVIADARSKDFF